MKLHDNETALGKIEISVTRLQDDPSGLRVSVGEENGQSSYCLFRGDPEDCLDLLERSIMAMRLYIRSCE